MRSFLGFSLLALLGAAGCAGLPEPDERVTIGQGIYGETTHVDSARLEPKSITFDVLRVTDGKAVSSVRTNEDGFFERTLDAGTYRLCTAGARCTVVRVVSGARVRVDYTTEPGRGWSRCDETNLDTTTCTP